MKNTYRIITLLASCKGLCLCMIENGKLNDKERRLYALVDTSVDKCLSLWPDECDMKTYDEIYAKILRIEETADFDLLTIIAGMLGAVTDLEDIVKKPCKQKALCELRESLEHLNAHYDREGSEWKTYRKSNLVAEELIR